MKTNTTNPGSVVNPGNAGLRTRIYAECASTEPRVPGASTEPRVPGASTEPRVPGASTEPRVPGASTEPRVPGASTEPRVPGAEPRGWYSRGYIPHFDSNNVIQHVTFHLADSLPQETVERLLKEIQQLDPDRQEIEKRRHLEALVDAGHGACWLRRPDCAQIVQNSLLHFDGERYRMIAWVVMPNHVHTLFQTVKGWHMNAVIGSWKTFTANAIGRIVRRSGEPLPHVWHPEFWDRFIRDQNHLASTLAYIHNNPVKAGLATCPQDWPWSSANMKNAGSAGSAGNAGNAGSAGLRTRMC